MQCVEHVQNSFELLKFEPVSVFSCTVTYSAFLEKNALPANNRKKHGLLFLKHIIAEYYISLVDRFTHVSDIMKNRLWLLGEGRNEMQTYCKLYIKFTQNTLLYYS